MSRLLFRPMDALLPALDHGHVGFGVDEVARIVVVDPVVGVERDDFVHPLFPEFVGFDGQGVILQKKHRFLVVAFCGIEKGFALWQQRFVGLDDFAVHVLLVIGLSVDAEYIQTVDRCEILQGPVLVGFDEEPLIDLLEVLFQLEQTRLKLAACCICQA